MDFITQNLSTIIVLLIVVAIFLAIVINGVLNKKNGKSSCSCGCKNCPSSGACHNKNGQG